MRRLFVVVFLAVLLFALGTGVASADTRWVHRVYWGSGYVCDYHGGPTYIEHMEYDAEQYYDYDYRLWIDTGQISYTHLASYPHIHKHYNGQYCA